MKYISLLRYALIVISLIVTGYGLATSNVDSGADVMLLWAEIMLYVTIGAVLILSVYNLVKNPKSAGRSLLGILCVVVVLGISYAMSDSTPIVTVAATYEDAGILKLSDTELFTTYIVFGLAIVSIILTEVYNLIKK